MKKKMKFGQKYWMQFHKSIQPKANPKDQIIQNVFDNPPNWTFYLKPSKMTQTPSTGHHMVQIHKHKFIFELEVIFNILINIKYTR